MRRGQHAAFQVLAICVHTFAEAVALRGVVYGCKASAAITILSAVQEESMDRFLEQMFPMLDGSIHDADATLDPNGMCESWPEPASCGSMPLSGTHHAFDQS